MRSIQIALALSALLALAPAPSGAAWPTGGLQVASPYTFNCRGKLVHDGTGHILSQVNNCGHGNWWILNRVTPDGEYAAGWDASGTSDNVGMSSSQFAVAPDASGGIWQAGVISGPNVGLNRATASGSFAPSGFPWTWTVAGTTATEDSPGVAGDGGTGAFVAWWSNFQHFYVQRVDANGIVQAGWPVGGKRLLSEFQSAQIPPAMLADGSGGVLVMANGYDGTWLFRVDATGALPASWEGSGLFLDVGGATTVDLVPSDASHVFAVWTAAGRVASLLVPIEGLGDPGWPGAEVELFSAAQSATMLDLVPDGLGGLHALCRTGDGGARWQHVDASGALAPGFGAGGLSPLDDDAVIAPTSTFGAGPIVGAAGNDGGLIAFWRDLRTGGEGARARWLLSDGTPDPAEPPAGRLVAADAPPYTSKVLDALGDGDGGAYLLWSASGELPYYSTAYLSRVFSSEVLGVGPSHGSALALSLWPNPTREALTVRLTLPLDGTARLSLHDVTGRLVASREVTGPGEHVERLDDVGVLAPGVYLLTLAQGADTRRARVAVVR